MAQLRRRLWWCLVARRAPAKEHWLAGVCRRVVFERAVVVEEEEEWKKRS